ncbi:hypothetical protein T01_8851, partial [Trichinella spiralis]
LVRQKILNSSRNSVHSFRTSGCKSSQNDLSKLVNSHRTDSSLAPRLKPILLFYTIRIEQRKQISWSMKDGLLNRGNYPQKTFANFLKHCRVDCNYKWILRYEHSNMGDMVLIQADMDPLTGRSPS